jgi:hypothetical protein
MNKVLSILRTNHDSHGPDPAKPILIRTERGVGYYFDAPVKAMR